MQRILQKNPLFKKFSPKLLHLPPKNDIMLKHLNHRCINGAWRIKKSIVSNRAEGTPQLYIVNCTLSIAGCINVVINDCLTGRRRCQGNVSNARQ